MSTKKKNIYIFVDAINQSHIQILLQRRDENLLLSEYETQSILEYHAYYDVEIYVEALFISDYRALFISCFFIGIFFFFFPPDKSTSMCRHRACTWGILRSMATPAG